ncbi:membrane-spanning 4-domains subfamily A member 4A-like isoform X2 [Pelodiscus sinensis]|uniref:membrane-spanning 4-domains subfamily A member 4A-like isoform X2 n=1 Tax=Pelodiscus sinensis TaxID=13735 RepID=UPI003F6D8C9E
MEAGSAGVVVLTQIIPQHPSSASSAPPRPLRKFFQGEPLALGITQILTGIVQVAFGTILILADNHYLFAIQVGTPLWTGMLMKGMLAMNILSAIMAGVGIILSSLSLVFHAYRSCSWTEHYTSRAPACQVPLDTVFGVAMILLIFTILEFCVSISSATFGCKTLCRDSYSDTSVVIYQNMGPPSALADIAPKSPPPYQDTQTP